MNKEHIEEILHRLEHPVYEGHDVGSTGVVWELTDGDILEDAAKLIKDLIEENKDLDNLVDSIKRGTIS